MNFEVDHDASNTSLKNVAQKIPLTPTPTSSMDAFLFHKESLGCIESNIKPLVISLIDQLITSNLGAGSSLPDGNVII